MERAFPYSSRDSDSGQPRRNYNIVERLGIGVVLDNFKETGFIIGIIFHEFGRTLYPERSLLCLKSDTKDGFIQS